MRFYLLFVIFFFLHSSIFAENAPLELDIQCPATTTQLHYSICQGDDYNFPDGSFQGNVTADISQTSVLTSYLGCDSTIITNLYVNIPVSYTTSYDCATNEIILTITDMGLTGNPANPEFTLFVSGSYYSISSTGTYLLPANPYQSWRIYIVNNFCTPTQYVYPDNCIELGCENGIESISNGDFEDAVNPVWTTTSVFLDNSPTGFDIINGNYVYNYPTESLSAHLGADFDVYEGTVSSISQDIIIPSGIETTLSWWQYERWSCSSDDNLSVYIDGTLAFSKNATDDNNCNNDNWHFYDVDISAFADDATHSFSMVYSQPNTYGTTRLHLDNISVFTCPCPDNFTTETVEICAGLDYILPDGTLIENITENEIYTSNVTTSNGCDSIVETTINVSGGIPQNYDATVLSNTSALVTWNATSGTAFYQVKYRIKGTAAWLTIGSNNPQRTLNNLTANKYYQYKIRSQCGDGSWSDFTEIDLFYTSNCDIPTGVASVYLDDTRVKIRWDNNVDAYKGKVKYRAIGTSTWLQKGSTPGNNFLYITGLTPSTDYEYRVRNNCNNGEWSAYSNKNFFSTYLPRINSDILKSSINVFPNPTSGNITITSKEDWNNVTISIMDISGKVISTQEVSEQRNLEMNIKGAAGIYFIEVISNGERAVFRVVKE